MPTDRDPCFVVSPLGTRSDASGRAIDFDAVYQQLLGPAVHDAGLEPFREDDMAGGMLSRPALERLVACELAVADLSTAAPWVLYQLGVRHAARPAATLLVMAEGTRPPFDLSWARVLTYRVDAAGRPVDHGAVRDALGRRLAEARDGRNVVDSPVFQLLDGSPARLPRQRGEEVRGRMEHAARVRERLAAARRDGREAVRRVEDELGEPGELEAGMAVELLLAYRAAQAWDEMVRVAQSMPPAASASSLVQEQLALALNRLGRGDEAERVLLYLLQAHGPSSETYGLLGRVYKDRFDAAARAGDALVASVHLDRAIDAYLNGFETDWRDAYPGVNAVTLMELRTPPDPRRAELVPVVAYAVRRRIARGAPDYWDFATLLELAVLADDREKARTALRESLSRVREPWEPETTARNLRLIRDAREARGTDARWIAPLEEQLLARAAPPVVATAALA